MRLIRPPVEIVRLLQEHGVNRALIACNSLRDALTQTGILVKKSLNTDFINPFLNATIQVLGTQTQTVATPGKIFLSPTHGKFSGDISGVIGLVTDAFNGSVAISFPKSSFLKIMSRMIGEEVSELTDDIESGAGELTNIIFGSAKVVLNQKGYGIKMALPTIVKGQDHSGAASAKSPSVIVPFNTDLGEFFVEICLSE